MKNYTTKDLGCAAFLHAHKFKINDAIKEGKLVSFTFDDFETTKSKSKDYYNGGTVCATDYWNSLKVLKTIIHTGV